MTQARTNLKGLDLTQLEALMAEWSEKPYRARQLANWIYARGASEFSRMSNLGKELKSRLVSECSLNSLEIAGTQTSPHDQSTKFLFRLEDGETVESVLIKDRGKNTICVSSQVGCPLACLFCATGFMGYKRNLTAGEIIDQILVIKPHIPSGQILNNIVYMGMGEPLLNYDNVIRSIRILSSDYGIGISAKRITLSTAGVVPRMYDLAQEGLKLKLAVSLHAPEEELRKKLMPIADKHSLKDLLDATRKYAFHTGQRVTFEYILIRSVNDSEEHALQLARLVANIPCKINLIVYNPIPDAPFERPTIESAQKFRQILLPRVPAVTLRISKGTDIQAACGQLKTKVYKKQKKVDFSPLFQIVPREPTSTKTTRLRKSPS
ncbi:MAG: 23S rRNA (adenine(2503)-C(2))-methyltransferase RlmN [candidate division Zixibacteria bacterium]|nr:23S rRNA (adenine(2503)-C(2))-methyltransferase RlmN [candidate division Zixibacteria bacterium]